ncbi:multimerin-2a [Salarias fasciatus]|uniref:multimerin-2a n=1 Tax=Salarias fasciatus TaxID=181472 RepID=UPI0011768864|nr:multimerin-2 [Salarias fasciatus]
MMAVGELLLVLALLVSAHCEVRARDPEEEEQDRILRGGARFPPPHPKAADGDPARTGLPMQQVYGQNQKVFSGLLWHCCLGHRGHHYGDTVSQHHPPAESSALAARSRPERMEIRGPGVQARLQLSDTSGEQNDDHRVHQPRYLHYQQPQQQQPQQQQPHQQPPQPYHHPQQPYHHPQQQPNQQAHQQPHQQPQEQPQQQPQQQQPPQQQPTPPQQQQVAAGDGPGATPPPSPEAPDVVTLVMSQLQPFLQGFNRSLEQLSLQVSKLSWDVEELKSSQSGAGAEQLDPRLDEVYEHVRTMRWQVEQQRAEVDSRLHSQHAMLHYNLTSFKTDIDMKLKRHQKMLQLNLQAMNATLAELKQDQDWGQDRDRDRDQDREEDRDQAQIKEKPDSSPPTQKPLTSFDTSALWQAIERLDNKVVNNSVKVSGLLEDMEVVSGGTQQLRRNLKDLERWVNQTARRSQVLFMETGLEVEAAKVAVLRRVQEMAVNLSQQGQRLQEMGEDLDYVFHALYKHNTSTSCHCQDLRTAVARLERGVANVTQLANENRRSLEESEGGVGQWGGTSDWEELQHTLWQVKESVSSEQTRTRSLEEEVGRLRASSSLLQEADGRLEAQMKLLSASFASLLKDAIRHSEVLEVLLGEEVLEFLDWPLQDQEAHSIPSLKEQLLLLQEQLRPVHEELRGAHSGGRGEVPSADQPSFTSSSSLADDWSPGGRRRSVGGVPARERQQLLPPGVQRVGGDGSDLWKLEQAVEEVQRRLLHLEETPCSCPDASSQQAAPPSDLEAKLLEEVTWLKRGLEEHLRVFKDVFSNADVVAAANQPLELDQLWRLLRSSQGRKEGKKRRAGGGEATERAGGHTRSRREATGVFSQSGGSLLFVGGAPQVDSNGVLRFQPSLNRGGVYSGGVFVAPSDGVYLIVLSLDMRPGPAHLVLRRGGAGGGAPVSLQQREIKEAGPVSSTAVLPLREGEELRPELRAGQWVESADNLFVGLLLHQLTT